MSPAPSPGSIESLLIDVASPDRHEDSPVRQAAWDEIKRRLSVAQEALKLYADPESWEVISRSSSDWSEYQWQGDDGKEHAWELAADALKKLRGGT